jgi:hypothetical protein
VNDKLHHLTFVMCAYECVALNTKLPTLSCLSARYRWLAPVLVAGLAAHLYRYGQVSHDR